MKNKVWNYWNKFPDYGDMLYKRATGELGEMECSKALSNIITTIYEKEMHILDVGCGAGHYYRSFKTRIDPDISFTGVDITPYYIELANKAYGDEASFSVGDIYDLDFDDEQFDIVTCNNTIPNLPPPPTSALKELLRVSSKYVIIRTLIGKRNYVIQKLRSAEEVEISMEEKDLIGEDGELRSYNYLNMYTENYYRQILSDIETNLEAEFRRDTDFSSFDNTKNTKKESTKIVNSMQISGNLILDWHFVIIEK